MAGSVTSSANSAALRQQLRGTTEDLLKQYFGSTLNTVDDMANIFLALMLKESSFNVNAAYKAPLSPTESSGARDYYYSPAIQAILGNSSTPMAANEPQGRTALGLTQVMGWNLVRGASRSGKCLIEQVRPDLVDSLCVNPGEDIRSKLLGMENIRNSILAGLVVLESKYRLGFSLPGGGWGIRITKNGQPSTLQFPSHIYAAVAGYLGYGSSDANGTTYSAYASEIVGGTAYTVANGAASPLITTSKFQTASSAYLSPTTSGTTGSVPGCVTKASSG